MTARHPAWDAIGIDPTDDLRAIRIAYAAQLKAIDPDTDPKAFIALREARDIAERIARGMPVPDIPQPRHRPEPDPEPELPAETYAVARPPAREQAAPSPADIHTRALYQLLYGQREGAPSFATPGEREAMLAHWEGMLEDPRILDIGFLAELEHWAAPLIAHATPLSDPLVIPAAELFGWNLVGAGAGRNAQIDQIAARYGWLRYIEDVQQADHPHHAAWMELNRDPGPEPKRGRVTPIQVTNLLIVIRQFRPDLAQGFDPRLIELWERMIPDPVPYTKPRQTPFTCLIMLLFVGGLFALVLGALSMVRTGGEQTGQDGFPLVSSHAAMPDIPDPNAANLATIQEGLRKRDEARSQALRDAFQSNGSEAVLPPPEDPR